LILLPPANSSTDPHKKSGHQPLWK